MSASVVADGRERNRVVGLVAAGHFYSHFVMLCLPPMFPFMRDDLGVGYAALGTVMAALNAVSGIGQIPTGFLVDRLGGRRVLAAGIGLMGVALAAAGFLGTGYWPLVVLFAVAGLGNSVFHPADYAILNARIDRRYFGRAASVHTFAGYLGWTAAPPVMLALVAISDWRHALGVVGLAGIGIAATIIAQGRLLEDHGAGGSGGGSDGPADRATVADGLRLMRSLPMTMMFAFYTLTAAATTGLMAFSAVALNLLDGIDLVVANGTLTGHLFASACGVLVGGWLADRTGRHNLVTSLVIVLMALCVAALAWRGLPFVVVFALMAGCGLFYGISSPSRDVIVKAVTPPGSMGVAFGFTATGLSLGNTVSPVLFGRIMDLNRPDLLFLGIALVIAASTVTVVLTRPGLSRR